MRRVKKHGGPHWNLKNLPKGCLNPDRLHFYGLSMTLLRESGIKWARIRSDWSVTICRHDGTTDTIPTVVMCCRDRMNALKWILTKCVGGSTDDIELVLDEYDRELVGMMRDQTI